jgi:hypothetical protein
MGAFYSYDKYERMGNQTFRYNFIHNTDEGDGIYFDHDHRDMHVYGNVVDLRSSGRRGYAFLYKRGSQAQNPQTIDCHDNLALNANTGFVFVTGPGSRIERNVALKCKTPFIYRQMVNKKEIPASSVLASGPNPAYCSDPGFVSPGTFDYRLKADSTLLKDLPGFSTLQASKSGLYVDEYRKKLPTDQEIDRFSNHSGEAGLDYAIEDRK